ncbi:MAG: hypothetical protein RBT65_18390 [Methanolobus sp.]|nr:hypothetical protein [Methanolobus sp.]
MILNPEYIIQAAEFDYTFMGKSEEDISRVYNIPLVNVQHEVRSGNWVRKIEPAELPATSDIEKFTEQLKTITEKRLTIVSLFRQIENQPLYAQIEKVLLQKILVLAEQIEPADDKAALKLTNLTKALGNILERNPINLSEQVTELSKGKGSVTVLIQNNLSGQVQ